MKKRLAAVFLTLVLLFTAFPAVPARAFGDDALDFECLSAFSEGLAWVRYEDQPAGGLGVINQDLELVYAFNEKDAQSAFYREKGDHLDFELYPFRDGISYYQAEGYGYVIIDDEGDELASDIWTAVHEPYIMARGEDYFLVREYDAMEECWYVYAINAHGKIKGKKVSYEEKPEYRYIGAGLYLGTGGEDEEVFFSEDEKKTFENDNFYAEDFYGFSDNGEGFVFLDGDYDRAYMISEAELKDEDEWEDWAENADWFDADEATVECYDETVGSGMFYSVYDDAYIDFCGNVAVEIPDFGKYEPVSFGRFADGLAPVLLAKKDTYYVTYIDEWGSLLYEPSLLGETEDGSVPVLTDAFYRTGYAEDAEDDTTYIVYGNGRFVLEADGESRVVEKDGSHVNVAYQTYGADDDYYYMSNGLIDSALKHQSKVYPTEDTQEAELDWLMYASFAGIYDGSDGTILVLLSDGTGYYREPQSTTKEDLLQGVEITFEVSEGTLKVYNLAYPIYADVTGFEGSMLMLATDPGWHPEEFVRRSRDKEEPIAGLLDPGAKLPVTPPSPPTPPGGEEPKPEPPKTDPNLYTLKDFSFRMPQHWVNRGCTVQIRSDEVLTVFYRGRWFMSLQVIDPEEYTSGDPATGVIHTWTLPNGRYVVMWVDNIAYFVCRMGLIPEDKYMYGGPGFTSDGDLEDFLYTVTGKDFPNIADVKGKLTLETPELIPDEARDVLSAYSDFFDKNVIPAVTLH